jgi:hypothetical protein
MSSWRQKFTNRWLASSLLLYLALAVGLTLRPSLYLPALYVTKLELELNLLSAQTKEQIINNSKQERRERGREAQQGRCYWQDIRWPIWTTAEPLVPAHEAEEKLKSEEWWICIATGPWWNQLSVEERTRNWRSSKITYAREALSAEKKRKTNSVALMLPGMGAELAEGDPDQVRELTETSKKWHR